MSDLTTPSDLPLLVLPSFFDRGLCGQVRAAMDRGVSETAEIVGDVVEARDVIRRTRSIDVDPAVLRFVEERLDSMRPIIEQQFGRRLGRREGTGFLRYDTGGFYLPHRDRGDVPGWPGAAHRAVALVVFLNGARAAGADSSFTGGALCLYPEPPHSSVEIHPRTGMLAAFPADLLHEVLVVRSGTRDTAVDWFYDPTE